MKKCLIVVDYQNDFVIGSLGFKKAKLLDENICNKILEYRKNGDMVVFTLDTHGNNYLDTHEGKNLPIVHCVMGTEGHSVYGKTGELVSDKDIMFCKSAFGSHELYKYLRKEQFDSIELVGVITNICVISNAILAKTACPESEIIVDALCVASNDEKLNDEALNVMESMHIKVINR